jgi:hypothetical protein
LRVIRALDQAEFRQRYFTKLFEGLNGVVQQKNEKRSKIFPETSIAIEFAVSMRVAL